MSIENKRSMVFEFQSHLLDERLQQVKTCFYGCRFLSRVAFDVFWQKAFAWLEDLGEKDLVEKLQRFYFVKTEKGWCGEWAGGYTRCRVGRWVGSQPQESWHKHRLRTTMRDLYQPADVIVEKIASLFQSNADQKSIRSEGIHTGCFCWGECSTLPNVKKASHPRRL